MTTEFLYRARGLLAGQLVAAELFDKRRSLINHSLVLAESLSFSSPNVLKTISFDPTDLLRRLVEWGSDDVDRSRVCDLQSRRVLEISPSFVFKDSSMVYEWAHLAARQSNVLRLSRTPCVDSLVRAVWAGLTQRTAKEAMSLARKQTRVTRWNIPPQFDAAILARWVWESSRELPLTLPPRSSTNTSWRELEEWADGGEMPDESLLSESTSILNISFVLLSNPETRDEDFPRVVSIAERLGRQRPFIVKNRSLLTFVLGSLLGVRRGESIVLDIEPTLESKPGVREFFSIETLSTKEQLGIIERLAKLPSPFSQDTKEG